MISSRSRYVREYGTRVPPAAIDPGSNPPAIAITLKISAEPSLRASEASLRRRRGFPGGTLLPDYNVDGDRSYAWPCWDVTDPEPANSLFTTHTPLRPEATVNDTSTHEALASVMETTA